MNRFFLICLIGVVIMFGMRPIACAAKTLDYAKFPDPKEDLKVDPKAGDQIAVLAGGCFWCTEAVFENMPGVTNVVAGYSGGSKDTANYDTVCTGETGHAESIQVTYDPAKTSYGKILKEFFAVAHDPTQLNGQGPDEGTQYRSAIFYANDEQKHVAEAYIKQLTDEKVFDKPIVTTLEPLKAFYPAEGYHQEFFKNHPDQPYIRQEALPKVEKAKKAAKIEAARAADRAPTTKPAH
jgi:peptide-methionine (S)-S-oxide reductase